MAWGESDELQRRADTRRIWNEGNQPIQASWIITGAALQGPQLWRQSERTMSRMTLFTIPILGKAVVAWGESDELQRRADTRRIWNEGNTPI
ncbi:hypothetical protein JCM15764A_27320 [Geotalea toluenoxydans]